MEHYKEKHIPAATRKVLDKTTCDMCNKEIDQDSSYDINEVEVRHKKGVNYPEGGSGDVFEPDICGECFDDKLVPWLKSQGVKITKKNWD